jgi:hypothetical protein
MGDHRQVVVRHAVAEGVREGQAELERGEGSTVRSCGSCWPATAAEVADSTNETYQLAVAPTAAGALAVLLLERRHPSGSPGRVATASWARSSAAGNGWVSRS